MTDSTRTNTIPAALPSDCLGRTCLKWRADGELTALDLGLVLARLAQVDEELTGTPQEMGEPLPCQSIC
jgi:hypothetical protein